MGNVFTRARVILTGAVLVAGTALFFYLRQPAVPPDKPAAAPAASGMPPGGAPFTPPSLASAATVSTAEIALTLAGWPEGKGHPDLPGRVSLLAARNTDAIPAISSALATAGSNTARGLLADALARIGTDDAIQELCTAAIRVPEGETREAIATSFRALSRPEAVPMLASVFSEMDSGVLLTEAGAAIRRLAGEAGVEALADMCQEGGQLYSQREAIFGVLSTLENPDALPALEVLAADETDPARAAAARQGIAGLREAGQQGSTP